MPERGNMRALHYIVSCFARVALQQAQENQSESSRKRSTYFQTLEAKRAVLRSWIGDMHGDMCVLHELSRKYGTTHRVEHPWTSSSNTTVWLSHAGYVGTTS